MNVFVIPPLVSSILFILLGVFVFFKNPRSNINQAFGLMCLVTFWWQFSWFILFSFNTEKMASIMVRVGYSGIIFIPYSFYHFFIFFLKKNREKKIVPFAYLAGLFFLFFNWSSNLFIKGYYKYSWGYYPKAGILHPLYLLTLFAVAGRVTYLLYKESFDTKSSPARYNQVKYLLCAFVIYTLASFDFVVNYGVGIYPIGFIFIIISLSIMAYIIVKYHLLDIKVVFARAWIFIIVYLLVLGVPLGLTGWGKNSLQELLGVNWYWAPVFLAIILASAGPFIYTFLRRQAEEVLLHDQRHYQRTLTELSKTMGRIRDLDELVKAIAKRVVDTVKVSLVAVYLYSEDYKSYQLKECYPAAEKERFQELITPDYPLVSLLNQQKKPLLSEEVGSMDKIKLNNGLVIPCFIGDSLIAFLAIGSKVSNQMYTPDDVLAFEALSYSTALAIENSQFWKEIEERQRQARIAEMDLFSYSVAHEIDNPMSVIKGQVGLIRKTLRELGIPKDKLKNLTESLDFIDDAQDRTSTMVNAIEDYGKPVPADLVTLKLEDVVSSFFMLYKPQFKHEGVYFEKEISVNLPLMKGIKQELVQVLVNFANNSIHAVKAVPQGQQKIIRLKAELPSPDLVRISFSDNGYGIVKDKIKAVFAPFVTTKASTEGKGMGLSTVTKIIQKHHGRVWAESPGKGKGATMIVELPIAKDDSQEPSKGTTKTKRMF